MTRSDRQDFGSLKVVILAGGFGTRLAERTADLPKPMVEIGGLPVLWHLLKIYGHHDFNDFIIACGYKSMAIKRFFLEYRHRHSDLIIDYANDNVTRLGDNTDNWRVGLFDTGIETMTGGRLKRLANQIGNQTFLMTYGDGLSNVDLHALVKFHRSHGKLATFTAVHPPPRFGRPQFKGDQVVAFDEKSPDADDWINGGFFVLEPGVLDLIAGDETAFEQQPLQTLAKDGELMAYRHDQFWHPMDTLRDVRNLNNMWNSGKPPWKVWDQ